MFCREIVSDLRTAREADAAFPSVLLVHQGDPAQGDTFFEGRDPMARAIADPERELYAAFAVPRGRFGQVLGLRSVLRGLGVMMRGHGIGKAVGDPFVMPGAFLIHEQAIVWAQNPRHAGDHPDLEEVKRAAEPLRGSAAANSTSN